MSGDPRALCALAAGVLALWGCTAPLVTAEAPKVVSGYEIRSNEFHEECLRLKPGDRVEYTFESTEPVEFNIHFHDGAAVVMPVVRENSRGDGGVFAPPLAHDYCLMWQAGAAGALIDYRVRLRPAAR